MKRLLLLSLLLFLNFASFSQGKVQQSKEDIQKEKTESPSRTRTRSTESSNSVDEHENHSSNFFSSIPFQLFYYAIIYVPIGRYRVEEHLYNRQTVYPHVEPGIGNYTKYYNLDEKNKFRIDISDQVLIANELYGNHLKVKIRPFQFFYIQADYFELIEPKTFESGFDNLSLFNFNFCYDRLRFERFNLGWNLGANYIGNGVNKFGFTYGLNLEAFFKPKLSLYSSIKGGFINGSPVDEFEVNLRYHHRRYFASAGYERLKIGSPIFNFFAFGGGVYF